MSQSIPTDLRATDIAAGYAHVCAVTTEGKVACWGNDEAMQLGDEAPGQKAALVFAATQGASRLGLSQSIPMNAYSCAALASGEIDCWGRSLPYGKKRDPKRSWELTDVTQVATGDRFLCVLRRTGQVACVGENASGQLGIDSRERFSEKPVDLAFVAGVEQVVAGQYHACVRWRDGRVACWGGNQDWQLGDGTHERRLSPVPVLGLTDAIDLSAGPTHSCAVRRSGEVICWGSNRIGQLGNGHQSQTTAPGPVLELEDAVQVSCGVNHTCALLRSGKVSCWGEAADGELGHGRRALAEFRPVEVVGLSDAVRVAAGGNFTCAIRKYGGVSCWGSNVNGRLGVGVSAEIPMPALISNLSEVAEVGAGDGFTCARHKDGRVSCWGFGKTWHVDRRGTQREHAFPPEPIQGVAGVRRMFVGDRTICTVDQQGSVNCWLGGLSHVPGVGKPGETGWVKPAPQIKSPVVIEPAARRGLAISKEGKLLGWIPWRDTPASPFLPLTDIIDVKASLDQACALHNNGTVDCWQDSPMLATTPLPELIRVEGLSDAVAIAKGGPEVTYALRRDQTVVSFGRERSYKDGKLVGYRLQTGNHSPDYRGRCRECEDLGPLLSISAGRDYLCGITTNHQVICRGSNRKGQSGHGIWIDNPPPSPISTLFDVVQISAGYDHVCALRQNGTVSCWGSNDNEQISDLGPPFSTRPLPVVGFVK